MVKQLKLHNCRLQRVHSKLGEIITWEVFSEGGFKIAIIAQKNSEWAYKTIPGKSWCNVRVKYWIAHILGIYPPFPMIITDTTRKDIIIKILKMKGLPC